MLAWASSVATGRSSRDLELRISNNPHIVLLARLFNRHLLILAAVGDNGRLLIPTLALDVGASSFGNSFMSSWYSFSPIIFTRLQTGVQSKPTITTPDWLKRKTVQAIFTLLERSFWMIKLYKLLASVHSTANRPSNQAFPLAVLLQGWLWDI